MAVTSISIVSDDHEPAQLAAAALKHSYDNVEPEAADVIVALGGDGFMLSTLHKFMNLKKPIYGMNLGSVGFLMNEFQEIDLIHRVQRAEPIVLHPLTMTAVTADGNSQTALAINEVSLLRETRYAAKIKILVDGVERLDELVCDGVLISTPAGSTAYNMSAFGPIIPLGAELQALTPISAFRPRRWRGALLPRNAVVTFEVIDGRLRPVSAVADFTEVRNVIRVDVTEEPTVSSTLLFDPEHNLEERILKEQFQP